MPPTSPCISIGNLVSSSVGQAEQMWINGQTFTILCKPGQGKSWKSQSKGKSGQAWGSLGKPGQAWASLGKPVQARVMTSKKSWGFVRFRTQGLLHSSYMQSLG